MGTPVNSARNLSQVVELFKAGIEIPIPALEKLIAGDAGVDDLLVDLLRSRAVEEGAWAALWALVALGERRCLRAVPDILGCLDRGHEVLREGVEFALLRIGGRAQDAVIRFLRDHEESPGRLHLLSYLSHVGSPRAIACLADQFRPESRDFIPVAWLLAGSGDLRALETLEAAVREFPDEPGLAEPLEAIRGGDDLTNPLLGDWRTLWPWTQEAPAPPEPPPREERTADREDPGYQPRAFDVACPACRSRLEFDSHTGESRVVHRGRPLRRTGPCPCGSRAAYDQCCGRKNDTPRAAE